MQYNEQIKVRKNLLIQYSNLIQRPTENKAYMLQLGSQKLPVYCHMTGSDLGDCGHGGWTLVMKIDGSKVTSFPALNKDLNVITVVVIIVL